MSKQAFVSPFAERLMIKDILPAHFEKLLDAEYKRQRREQQQGKRKYVQVNINKLYGYTANAAATSNIRVRSVVLSKTQLNPVLEHDIQNNQTKHFYNTLIREYKHQKKQVKLGLRKHIQVDYNDMYC
jgi:hypothetical protein